MGLFHRKPWNLIEDSAPCFLCWWCGQQLPQEFTSVDRDGEPRRVHYGCRSPAAAFLVALTARKAPPESTGRTASASVGVVRRIVGRQDYHYGVRKP